MKKGNTRYYTCLIIVFFALSVISCSFASSDNTDINLSILSLDELNQLKKDIDTENDLHYRTNGKMEDAIYKIVKQEVENYYSVKGCTISWPWFGWDYHYSREKDLFSFSSHVDYRNAENAGGKSDVSAELIFDGNSYSIYRLFIDKDLIISSDYILPDNLIADQNNLVIFEKTGYNLSLLNSEELENLKQRVNREIETNHNPHNSGKVHEVVKKTIEEYYLHRGVSSVAWPWFDYTYTCDWDCYTEKTRISYKENEVDYRDVPVYAEIFPDSEGYKVLYLKIGDNVILDKLDYADGENATLFLNKKLYKEADLLLADKNFNEAYDCFLKLGEFDDSSYKRELCLSGINQNNYDKALALMGAKNYSEAIILFDDLGDYSDSESMAQKCRNAMNEESYQKAIELMQKGDYEDAITAFAALAEYRDSNRKIEECQISILERNYEFAITKMNDGDYVDALDVFTSLNDYADSGEKALLCEENIKRQKYVHANELFTSAGYSEALNEFIALGDYQDSIERVDELRNIIPSLNREIVAAESEIILFQNQKEALQITINRLTQDAAIDSKIKYSSDNQNIARVDKTGNITAVQPGECVVHCEIEDNPYIYDDVIVRVVKGVNRITVSSERLTLSFPNQGENGISQLTYKVTPEDAYIQTGVWSSSNENVATIDQNGNVIATGIGHAILTFTSDDNSKGKKTATCNINVIQAVTSLALPEKTGDVFIGKPLQLKPNIEPQNAGNKKLTWASENEEIAKVNGNGVVTGISPGTVAITASSIDGPAVKFLATVKMPPVTLKVSGSAKLVAKNHVGNSWGKDFLLNGEIYRGTGKVKVENGDVITVGCDIWENDSNPDWGGFEEEIEITPEIMKKGTKIERTVFVTENGGRYSGYSAEWNVTITIKP